VHADGTFGSWGSAVRITGAIGQPGAPGEAGPAGPAGPPGNPGQLGIHAEGTTLYVKGYAEDGTLSASQGYIHVGLDRITVPAYSETLADGGQGYVVWTGSSVKYAKMVPNGSTLEWKDYETLALIGTPEYVLGRFQKEGTAIFDIQVMSPISPAMFTKEHFMQVLATEGWEDMGTWAQALGVAQVFESLAVWDFFANRIKTNNLEVSKIVGGQLFKLVLSNNGDEAYPIMQAWKGNTLVFEINSAEGSVYIKGGGQFEGTIDHEALLTEVHTDGNAVSVANTKDLWSTGTLYDSLSTVAEDAALQTASGSFAGKTINAIARVTPGQLAKVAYAYDASVRVATSTQSGYYWTKIVGKVVTQAGCSSLHMAASAYKEWSGNIGFLTFFKSASDYPIDHVFPRGEYGSSSGTVLASFQLTTAYAAYAWSASVGPNEKVYAELRYMDKEDVSSPKAYAKNMAFTQRHTLTGKGLFYRTADNTFGLLGYGQYRDDALSLASPVWASSSNMNFKKGDAAQLDSVVAALTTGVVYPANGTATIQPAGGTSVACTVQSVRKNANGATLGTTVGDVNISNWGGQGSTIGVYSTITISITLVGRLRAIRASSILPKDNGDGKDQKLIGSGTNPFISGYFTNVYATTVNATTVYGARFN
jgi:hypothetical protein